MTAVLLSLLVVGLVGYVAYGHRLTVRRRTAILEELGSQGGQRVSLTVVLGRNTQEVEGTLLTLSETTAEVRDINGEIHAVPIIAIVSINDQDFR